MPWFYLTCFNKNQLKNMSLNVPNNRFISTWFTYSSSLSIQLKLENMKILLDGFKKECDLKQYRKEFPS